jgi:hypothetical protein
VLGGAAVGVGWGLQNEVAGKQVGDLLRARLAVSGAKWRRLGATCSQGGGSLGVWQVIWPQN